jgi:3-hydroxyacyl-CoA dehydrogenase
MSIKTIGIVGAGVMGGELAFVATQAGLQVILKDVDQQFLDAGLTRCRQVYEFKVKRRRMSAEDMDAKLAMVRPTLDYALFGDVDLVIEAVPEKLAIKQSVFAELDKACPEHTVLASNTSALSIAAIGEKTARRDRVAGLHFFNPASMMPLVEVIRAEQTSEAAADIVRAAAESMGKTPVVCRDSAGFIVNRLLCAAMIEAMRCEAEGLADRRDIDSFLVKPEGGMPVGLFRMADQLGLALLAEVMGILHSAFGARFAVPEKITRRVAAGHLGVGAGKGFYDYNDAAGMKPTGSVDNRELIVARVLTAVVAEAKRMAGEGVASAADVDLAMRNGALFKNPPFAYIQETGEEIMNARLVEFADKYGGMFII